MRDSNSNVNVLIRAARQAEPGSLGKLLEAYRNYLGLLAQTWVDGSLQPKADPSDLVQDTLLKAQQRFGEFRGQTEPELVAWLRRILARNLMDFAQRFRTAQARRVSRECSLDASLGATSQALGNLIAANGTTPSQAAQRRELSVVLADALAELPPDYREVIVLRNLRELDWEQVAHKMGRSTDAVRMLWTRALKQLRPLIEALL